MSHPDLLCRRPSLFSPIKRSRALRWLCALSYLSTVLLSVAYVSAAPPSFSGARAFQDLKRYVELGHRYYGAPQREGVIKALREALSRGAL